MTTGEKIAALRKRKEITQDALAESLKVSRQSVSRWEMDAAFPETEKLIKLSKLLDCSIDFLLNNDMQENIAGATELSVKDCFIFIRECTYFFLATSVDNQPRIRPMGMIYADENFLYIATDNRKSVYQDLVKNPLIELASYNLNTRRWIRITGKAEVESAEMVKEEMLDLYPMIRQEYIAKDEIFFTIFRVKMENACIA